MFSKTPEERYIDAVTAAENRHRGLHEAAHRDHSTAVAKADAARELAVTAADDKLRDTTAKLAVGLRAKHAEALAEFDAATRRALQISDQAWLRQHSPTRVELRIGTSAEAVAVAVDEGVGRWVIDTATERKFLGSAVAARLELWRIAAAVPVPAA